VQVKITIHSTSGIYRCYLFPNDSFQAYRCERLNIGGVAVRQDLRWDQYAGRVYYSERIRGRGYNGICTHGQIIGVY
jgi:hypothetical protein